MNRVESRRGAGGTSNKRPPIAYNIVYGVAETRYIEGQGRYALAEMIGRGGFATVWRARSLGGSFRSRDVAVKIIPVYSVAERSRALREGQIAEGLKHRNIVETLEVIPGEHEVYLVTEYVRGMPLDDAARDYDIDELVDALAQILEALVYAHGQGIIHRDIKPQNALVDERGRVKLTDFGVAYRAGDTRLTRVGFAVGTPGYIAPEILDGADPTALTDIYAVGATCQALLSYQPEEPPPRLREFVDRATSPNPAHRPQSAWAALKLLTGRKAPVGSVVPAERKRGTSKTPAAWVSDGALRAVNGLAAAWLGYQLGSQLLNLDGALTAGTAAGLAVAGYLLPRLAALAVIVALAVALFQSGVGLGFSALVPALGGVWVAGGGFASRDVGRLPLGPVLAAPLALAGLGAGLPLLFGALMRPLGACLSSAAAALVLVGYDLTLDDARVPYTGVSFDKIPPSLGAPELVEWSGRIVQYVQQFHPSFLLLFLLWPAMAGAVSFGEWTGRWLVGLGVAVAGGVLAYALALSETTEALSEAMISLFLAAIIYGVLRYLVARG
ncbi:MAG TPA: serine/threonine-protein kinase [Rubrobacteraceae bacterium]|nr:serine/threonine-protein kinase [Rubrobacteraceae bacterium]